MLSHSIQRSNLSPKSPSQRIYIVEVEGRNTKPAISYKMSTLQNLRMFVVLFLFFAHFFVPLFLTSSKQEKPNFCNMNKWTHEVGKKMVGGQQTAWCSRKNTNGESENMDSRSDVATTASFTSPLKALSFTLQNDVFDLNSTS